MAFDRNSVRWIRDNSKYLQFFVIVVFKSVFLEQNFETYFKKVFSGDKNKDAEVKASSSSLAIVIAFAICLFLYFISNRGKVWKSNILDWAVSRKRRVLVRICAPMSIKVLAGVAYPTIAAFVADDIRAPKEAHLIVHIFLICVLSFLTIVLLLEDDLGLIDTVTAVLLGLIIKYKEHALWLVLLVSFLVALRHTMIVPLILVSLWGDSDQDKFSVFFDSLYPPPTPANSNNHEEADMLELFDNQNQLCRAADNAASLKVRIEKKVAFLGGQMRRDINEILSLMIFEFEQYDEYNEKLFQKEKTLREAAEREISDAEGEIESEMRKRVKAEGFFEKEKVLREKAELELAVLQREVEDAVESEVKAEKEAFDYKLKLEEAENVLKNTVMDRNSEVRKRVEAEGFFEKEKVLRQKAELELAVLQREAKDAVESEVKTRVKAEKEAVEFGLKLEEANSFLENTVMDWNSEVLKQKNLHNAAIFSGKKEFEEELRKTEEGLARFKKQIDPTREDKEKLEAYITEALIEFKLEFDKNEKLHKELANSVKKFVELVSQNNKEKDDLIGIFIGKLGMLKKTLDTFISERMKEPKDSQG